MRPPSQCSNMSGLRVENDAFDAQLIALPASCKRDIDRATIAQRPANTKDRVEKGVANARHLARGKDLDPTPAVTPWRAGIERSIARETVVFGTGRETQMLTLMTDEE